MAKDAVLIRGFIQESPIREMIGSALEKSGIEITFVERDGDQDGKGYNRSWSVRCIINDSERSIFDFDGEFLIWCSEFGAIQGRTIGSIVERLSKGRVRSDFCILISYDRQADQSIAAYSKKTGTWFVSYHFDEFKKMAEKKDALIQSIRKRVAENDYYRMDNAIVRPEAFFGRQGFVTRLFNHTLTGDGHVGIFGLRKSGKTSLVYQLKKLLLDHPDGIITAHVDAQVVSATSSNPEYLLWSIGESLWRENRSIKAVAELRLLGRYDFFSDFPHPERVWEYFGHDLGILIASMGCRIAILIDEIERVTSDLVTEGRVADVVRLWRLIRGIDQAYPGHIRLIMTGTNPSFFEENMFGSYENPAHQYISIQYLPIFTKEGASDLLQYYAPLAGVKWNAGAIEEIYRTAGKHPFLLRGMASMTVKKLGEITQETEISVTEVRSAIETFTRDHSAYLGQMIDVLRLNYQYEYGALESLAVSDLANFNAIAKREPGAISHLIGYGLVENVEINPKIGISIISGWIQSKRGADRAPSVNSPDSEIPSSIDDIIISGKIGHPSGFGVVYSGRQNCMDVAVKVILKGNIEIIQREVDILREVSHNNIVKFIDTGATKEGQPYLVMELLSGKCLREYCTASSKFQPVEVLRGFSDILSALRYLHPNKERHEELKRIGNKRELSTDEISEYMKTYQGYIHRDIKPENIMVVPGRGWVLIDFNISARALSKIQTMTCTDGYLPPDFSKPGEWTDDVDLFQLGLTISQALLGVNYQDLSLEGLRTALIRSTVGKISQSLVRMIADKKENRFRSANEIIEALQ